jgi:hypothetical protein
MKEEICINCGRSFIQSPRHKNHNYCKRKKCQRAKKADWQRQKMREDPEYKANQKLSNRKWRESNPDYWKRYRERNPEKAERNRVLQRLRNKKKASYKADCQGKIAKMDASEVLKNTKFKVVGQYWLVPVIAKMDALKVNIVAYSTGYQ